MANKIAYDLEWSDDEWRENNFSDTQIQSARMTAGNQPTVDQLIAAAEKYGPDGILESAIMLTQRQYRKVHEALAKMKGRKW